MEHIIRNIEMERKTEFSDAQEAFYILNSFYGFVSRGRFAGPGESLSIVRESSSGEKFDISRYKHSLNIQVHEASGMEMYFRVDEEGLVAASFVNKSHKRKDISRSFLFPEDREKFRSLSPELVPWFIDKYINIDFPKPLPKHAREVIGQSFRRAS